MMYTQRLIERYKQLRKKKFLDRSSNYQFQYAFIGVGQHSMSNLYPIIHYLGIPLRKICTRHAQHAQKMARRFTGCSGTDNINDILKDDTIKGVFVCTSPDQHYGIVSQLLQAGKQVFVEKPPCFSLQELSILIRHQQASWCQTGLQKRFSTITALLEPYRSKTKSYCYRYLTGSYPEGNVFFELFIHPVDHVIFLFGEVAKSSIHYSNDNATIFLHLTHKNGVSGMLHLSTDHSWQSAVDELEINTSNSILHAAYPFRLASTQKPVRFLNLPLEKILKSPVRQKVLLDHNSFSLTAANNSLVMQGFLGEIEHFVRMTEAGKSEDRHTLESLKDVYQLLDKMQAGIQ